MTNSAVNEESTPSYFVDAVLDRRARYSWAVFTKADDSRVRRVSAAYPSREAAEEHRSDLVTLEAQCAILAAREVRNAKV